MKTAKVELTGLKLRYDMKGVLGKDKLPFAAGSVHTLSNAGWKHPMDYNPLSILAALVDPEVKEVEVIDRDNNRFVLEIKR